MSDTAAIAPLTAYRALDLTSESGFLCGKILADLGVDVVKIEPPGGDPGRARGPFFQNTTDPAKSIPWFTYNTGKRSITLDLASTEGRSTLLSLVGGADFVIESFPPGRMTDLGLSYAELSAVNPGVILVSISAFGQQGPYAQFKAPDIVCMAMSGYMNLSGNPARPPVRFVTPQAYLHTSSEAAVGALIALWHRENGGEGQHVDVAAQQAMGWECFSNHNYWDLNRVNLKRLGNARKFASIISRMTFKCLDGDVAFHAFVSSRVTRRYRRLVDWMDAEGMASAFLREYQWEQMASGDVTMETIERLEEEFARFLQTKTKRQLFQFAVENGVQIAPMSSVLDLLEDPHLTARGYWEQVAHPELGVALRYPGAPYKSTESPTRVAGRAPLVGEHNAMIPELTQTRPACRPAAPEMRSRAASTEALRGIRIADFSWSIAGPLAARYFADHGATVVRVESADYPDSVRTGAPFKDGIPGIDRGSFCANYNTNKYAISLDLNRPDGVATARRLVQWADVFVESFSPGVVRKWGLDYDSVRDLNPRLIYASTSLMGQTGPYRQFSGYGGHAAAIAGFSDLLGWPDLPPELPFLAYTDTVAHRYLVKALLVALLHRKQTGRGQYIDQAQIESAVQFLATPLLDCQINGVVAKRDGNRDPFAAPHGAFRCAGEDRWCVIAVFEDEEWRALCRAIGRPELARDPRFATLSDRKEHESELERIVEEWTVQLPASTVMHMLQEAGVAAGVVQTAEELFADPQLTERGHFWFFDHPVFGRHAAPASPLHLSKTPARQYRRVPCLGENNELVCTELLGMSKDEYAVLKATGALGE